MNAMILAAGLGTRLRPLTNDRPKALVEVAGRTLLEITLARLRSVGVCDVIINVHHFADLVVEFLRAHDNFGMRVEISREDTLLDTGGGLKKAGQFFLRDASDEPFILHNVDILSTIDLRRMVQYHTEHHALATLAVQNRQSSRCLLFDETLQLCGRRRDEQTEIVRPAPQMNALAFSGVHVISPRLLTLMTGDGAFSIIHAYMQLASQGEKIQGFRTDGCYWRDLGKPESVRQAALDFEQGTIQ